MGVGVNVVWRFNVVHVPRGFPLVEISFFASMGLIDDFDITSDHSDHSLRLRNLRYFVPNK